MSPKNFSLLRLSSKSVSLHQSDAAYGPLLRRIHKRSPGVLISSKVAKLSALKGLFLVKAAGLGGAALISKKKKASKSAKFIQSYKTIKGGKKFAFVVGR